MSAITNGRRNAAFSAAPIILSLGIYATLRCDQKIALVQKPMSALQFYPSIASQVIAAGGDNAARRMLSRPPIALEITPTAPFDFSYTKVRVDTGEAIWRWPRNAPSQPAGQLLDLTA